MVEKVAGLKTPGRDEPDVVREFGRNHAVSACVEMIGRAVVMMDAVVEEPPEKMIQAVAEGRNVVFLKMEHEKNEWEGSNLPVKRFSQYRQ